MSKHSSSVEGAKHAYSRLSKWIEGPLKFWNKPKVQDPSHEDYRPSSEDLPIPSGCWTYNVPEYEKRLSEEVKHHRKFIKL